MQPPKSSPRFLVADDVPAIAFLVGELLHESGAEVVGPVSDGEAALRLFHEAAPDGVILDIEMPERNGLEVLRAIRASERSSRCLVIVLTSHSEPSMREQAYADGADHVLHKATEFERLLQIIPAFIQRARV